jgi:hypothetical protein
MFKIRPTTVAHIYAIMNVLSDISRHEIEAAEYTDWLFLKECSALLDSEGAEVETGFIDGEPVVIVGTFPHGQDPMVRTTLLLASAKFFTLGAALVREGRKYARSVFDRRPGCRFDVYTLSPHPDAVRWFRLLGFDGPIEEDGARLFRMYGKRRDDAKTKC